MRRDPLTPNDGEQQKWHRLTLMPESTPGEVRARAETEPTSPWYSGHFPGEPILPGIAQIAMVREAIGLAEDRPVRIAGLKRVRFKQVIQPGDGIDIRVRPREGDDDAYSFQVTVGGEVACSGIITLAGTGGRASARPQR